MQRLARLVEGVDLKPAVVGAKARGPDDGADAGGGQIEFAHGVHRGRRERADLARGRIIRQAQSIALSKDIRLIEQIEVHAVALDDVRGQIVGESHDAICIPRGPAMQRDALGSKHAEVHGAAAIRTAEGDGHVLRTLGGGLHVPQAQCPEPPDDVAAAIATRRARMGTDGQIHIAAGAAQFIGDLHARRAATHHQHAPVGELLRVAVVVGVHLQHRGA